MSGWTAIVLAGSRPGRDRFAAAHGTDLKALISVGGVAMVRRPVEALLASGWISRVLVVAQQPDRIAAVLPDDPRVIVARSANTIAATLEALCADPAIGWPLLVTTADHALLDAVMIDDFCRRSSRSDISIGLVERRRLLKRLPAARRSWMRFRGGAYSGANLIQLRTPRAAIAIRLWRAIEQDRKQKWRVLTVLGPTMFLGAILRLLTVEQVIHRLSNRLGLAIRVVEMRNPLAAVDIDKASDHALAEAVLAGTE